MDRVPLRAELLGEHVHSEGASGLPQCDLDPVPQRESLGKRRLVLERGEADPRSIAAEPDLVGHALLDRTHVGLTVCSATLSPVPPPSPWSAWTFHVARARLCQKVEPNGRSCDPSWLLETWAMCRLPISPSCRRCWKYRAATSASSGRPSHAGAIESNTTYCSRC